MFVRRSGEEYTYRCLVCHSTFASSHPPTGTVGCPHCGGDEVQAMAT
ncbi:hypothetical protein SAMN04487948_10677 [Halogranum amylolyticum]|uniref:Zinc ribbon domain-containing protein n=2 Tax=Halogranum amylolyticum TaxID=660520 RepID=A0A1H8T9F6_9EURY|nr:hypothetical protein SAMN04487948_10677 [Halogranum amylolyticum]